MGLLAKIKTYLTQNTSTKQTIIKNTLWLMVAEGVSKGSLFLITILIARKLGPEQFGIMSFVISFVSMFIVLTDFGLTTLMVRDVSRDQSKLSEYFVNGNFLKVILGIGTFFVVWGVSYFIGKPDFYINLILIYCGYAIISNIGEFIRSFFRPSERMQHEALLKVINGVILLIVMGYMMFFYWTLESIFLGFIVSGIVSLVISIGYTLSKFEVRKVNLNKEILKKNIKSGFYLMGGLIFIQIFVNIDQVMLGLYGFSKELGIYSAMYKFVFLATTVSQLFVLAIIPNMLKNYSFEKVKKILRILLMFSFTFLIFLCVFGNYFIKLVYGNDYLVGYNQLIILGITYVFISIDHLLYQLLNSLKFEKVILVFTIISGLVNLLLNLYFIPKYKAEGAAFTTLIAEVILLLLILRKYYKILKNYEKLKSTL